MSDYKPVTDREAKAIDELKQALKALPPSIHMSIDGFDDTIEFWKRHHEDKWRSTKVGQLRCKRAVSL